jgi:hypothetical protein
MTRRLPIPTADFPVVFHRVGNAELLIALVQPDPPTVGEMVEQLSKGKAVLCRHGAKARLSGELKRLLIWTRQKTVAGQVLFRPCGKRAFK